MPASQDLPWGVVHEWPAASYALLIISVAGICFLQLYRLALPKPIPGIPYNKASARRILGDVPLLRQHVSEAQGRSFATWLLASVKDLDAPLIQLFLKPFKKPLLILCDVRETRNIMLHRKDFDRSSNTADKVKGIAPDHHLRLRTNDVWRSHRRLVQDLVTPSFLHNVAGPQLKAKVAEGKPFEAGTDMSHAALDAVMSFAFGERFTETATRPSLELMEGLGEESLRRIKETGSLTTPIQFSTAPVPDILQAITDLSETIGQVRGAMPPSLAWALIMRKPYVKRATRIKEEYFTRELKHAVSLLDDSDAGKEWSAVHHMILRERSFAQKEGRQPEYFSRVMFDEIFGSCILPGHDTTSTTMKWTLKILADNPQSQHRLRDTLQASFAAAKQEARNPTIQEITITNIPFLDAVLEELQRCCPTTLVLDRQAVVDTELLGHHIPKDTVVICLTNGPSMVEPGFAVDEASRRRADQPVKKLGPEDGWDMSDVAAFRPERWLVQKEKGDAFNATAGPVLAFGLGLRGCFGKRLAYLEMRILLTLIIWNFELLQCPPALSGYDSVLVSANRPKDCYVRLKSLW
ncbi:cytochrome P450 [Trichoderma citrinoviride]|uniref:Cytochrome P450 n=1 Tax=Trichoderma citrinoviride TaxID=58853 RepID=A0A2T4BBR1_9HYPO|nr:cytochrome P450 [Trichoderma citrinoviride]PTB66764.1 cytochrome P450 [Trichoderma citrinoviride]